MNDPFQINRTRELSRDLGEQGICSLLGATRRNANKGADLRLDGETDIEVKCRLFGQPANILADQLLDLPESDIYALMFYRSIQGIRPLDIFQQTPKGVDSYSHFLDSVQISKIFLFPVWYIMRFYETTHMKELTISSSGRKHKGISVKTAMRMYGEAKEMKSVFATPFHIPDSPEALTYAVGEKVTAVLHERGYESESIRLSTQSSASRVLEGVGP